MIDPRTIYMIHQERINELTAQIERNRTWETSPSWYSIAWQWLKDRISTFSEVFANRLSDRAISG